MNIFELDSLWYFRRGTFQPYGIFGLGGANTGSSFGGANLTVVVGIGVKAFLSPHFAVRADIRWDNSTATSDAPAIRRSATRRAAISIGRPGTRACRSPRG